MIVIEDVYMFNTNSKHEKGRIVKFERSTTIIHHMQPVITMKSHIDTGNTMSEVYFMTVTSVFQSTTLF